MTQEPVAWRLFSTVAAMLLALLVTSCGRGNDADGSDSAAGTSRAFRVALLTPGPISDQSWNAGAYRGLERIRDSLGAQISHIQTKTPAEFEENFRQYGAQGYDLVFGHGFEFQDAALRVGPDHPQTIYVATSGNRSAGNVASMEFGFEDPSYLAGMAAGFLTKSNRLGAIGGTELPPVRRSFVAFEAGARAVNPAVRMATAYIGNWEDVSAAKEQALAQIARGADLIFQNTDAASFGIFQAVRERPGTLAFGTNSDQNGVAPDVIIGSVVIDLPHAFLTIAREVQARTFRPRVVRLGVDDDVTRFVINPQLANRLTPAQRASIDSVRTLIASGRFSPRADLADTVR